MALLLFENEDESIRSIYYSVVGVGIKKSHMYISLRKSCIWKRNTKKETKKDLNTESKSWLLAAKDTIGVNSTNNLVWVNLS